MPPPLLRGAAPLGLPHTRSREPVRRLAPFAWLASLRSLASFLATPCLAGRNADYTFLDTPAAQKYYCRFRLRSRRASARQVSQEHSNGPGRARRIDTGQG